MTAPEKNCFLCGIGGSGMSALARLLQAEGWIVSGSDRSYDRGETPEKFKLLADAGFRLFPQDGSGIADETAMLVVSSAVEDSVPDVRAARDKGIEIKRRAEVLAGLFNKADISIGIAGTSGKSTVTAMTGWICAQAGLEPTVINGAPMNNFNGQNAVIGAGKVFIAEIDESDGSIALFNPSIGLVTNISLDHMPMAELENLFGDFLARAGMAVINREDQNLGRITPQKAEMFAVEDIAGLSLLVPGRHNRANAAAALAAACAAGVGRDIAERALAAFTGIYRRFDILGSREGITVIDDFAHNPDKIAATLATLKEQPGRVIAIFQPHGFRPTKLMEKPLVESLARGLSEEDILIMPEIYYAGGTAERVISSKDIVEVVKKQGLQARFFDRRDDIIPFIAQTARAGDRIIVMGARDDTLPAFGRALLDSISPDGECAKRVI